MTIRFLRLVLFLGAATALLVGGPARAQASEEAVKAAFLPKFVRYIGMPTASMPAAGQPFYLCLIGRDPFGPLIDRAAANETIEGHAVAVRRFPTVESTAIAGCHIAFVAGSSDEATVRMLVTLRRQTTLTITDARMGTARGMIHFTVIDGRVRFRIDQAAASARSITISSRLLALAVGVNQEP